MSEIEKNSGYYFDGKEIILGRSPGRPQKIRNPTYFSQDTKIKAATLYCVYGDFERVAELTDVPVKYLRQWKQEPWWIEIQKQVYVEQNEHLASKISATLDKTIESLADRLENGDIRFNRNTGEMERVPVDAKTLSGLFNNLSHHRTVVRGEPTSINASIGIDDRLKTLQQAFLKFASAKTIEGEVIEKESGSEEVQDVQEGIQQNG